MALGLVFLAEAFKEILGNDVSCTITEDSSSFWTPPFLQVPHCEILCRLLIALAYGSPEETPRRTFSDP
jgi:hypothetical protein